MRSEDEPLDEGFLHAILHRIYQRYAWVAKMWDGLWGWYSKIVPIVGVPSHKISQGIKEEGVFGFLKGIGLLF